MILQAQIGKDEILRRDKESGERDKRTAEEKGESQLLKNIDKLLTGDLLKLLCDMGHGDELVIAEAIFALK